MFYAISKRRRELNAAADKGYQKELAEGIQRELNAAEARGYQKGLEEGIQRGIGIAALYEAEARLKEPGADPLAVIAQVRAELQKRAG